MWGKITCTLRGEKSEYKDESGSEEPDGCIFYTGRAGDKNSERGRGRERDTIETSPSLRTAIRSTHWGNFRVGLRSSVSLLGFPDWSHLNPVRFAPGPSPWSRGVQVPSPLIIEVSEGLFPLCVMGPQMHMETSCSAPKESECQ